MHVLMHAKLIDFVLFVFKYTMQITSMMEESDFNDARLWYMIISYKSMKYYANRYMQL